VDVFIFFFVLFAAVSTSAMFSFSSLSDGIFVMVFLHARMDGTVFLLDVP